MLRLLTYILLLLFGIQFGSTKDLNILEIRGPSSNKVKPYTLHGPTYRYTYDLLEPRWDTLHQRAAAPAITDRPLVRYWNNFVRNIRVPVPTITWNMTKPFINLFNAGAANVIDTPVREYENSNKRRKRKRVKNTRKHIATNTKNSIKQEQPLPPYDGFNIDMEQTLNNNQHKNPSFHVNTAMFFYDTITGQYYKIQQPEAQYTNNYAFQEVLHEPDLQEQQHQDELEEEHEDDNTNVHMEDSQTVQEMVQSENEQEVEEELAEQEVPEMEEILSSESSDAIEGSVHAVEQADHNTSEDLPSAPEGHVGGEVIFVPENDEEFEEERTLSRQSNRFILHMKPSVRNLEQLGNSMTSYVIRYRGSKKGQLADTKNNSKYKFVIYVLQI